MWGFVRALAGAHGKKVIQEVTDAIVATDPTTASAAQLEVMERDLDEVGRELAKFRAEAAREQSEADAVQSRFTRMRAAGDQLLARYNAETDPAKKADLEKSLNGLLTTLEEVKHELDQEAQEAVDANKLVAETEAIYQEKATALREAKTSLSKAARELEWAKTAQEHANMQAERAAQIAGLRDNEVGGLNAALTAMTRKAEEARGDAEAKRLKAAVLTKADHGSMDDPNVLEALASVQGTSPSLPFADRLAALGGPKPAPAPLQIEHKDGPGA